MYPLCKNRQPIIIIFHEGDRPYQCPSCEKSFSKKLGLSKHITSIHERKKPNKCHICDSCFVEKTDLKSHIARVHEGKNPYKCLTCDIDFSRKSSLTYTTLLLFMKEKSLINAILVTLSFLP